MNRIILIGNGFDLAHGLKTGYKDFLEWILKHNSCVLKYNVFFNHLYSQQDLNQWVDIESEYFNFLIKCSRKEGLDIKQLNSEFQEIKRLLTSYLKKVNRYSIPKIKKNIVSQIEQEIYSPIDPSEISSFECREKFYNELVMLLEIKSSYQLDQFKPEKLIIKREEYKNEDYYDFFSIYRALNPKNSASLVAKLFSMDLPKFFRLPEDILFLNFNYTKTLEKLYGLKNITNINHIHGLIDESMIFGYGDEHSKEYREIERLNNDDYLEYIKSISYLNSTNYSSLSDFIGSGIFEIVIMGHSCGITDRTLLKMLFEHENCISIRPYYRVYKDKSNKIVDNYSELIKSITRIFENKILLRSKVVNKLYCKPLLK